MRGLLGLTAGEAQKRHPGKKLVFRISGERKEGIDQANMRIIRVKNFEEKIECVLANPGYPDGKTPS